MAKPPGKGSTLRERVDYILDETGWTKTELAKRMGCKPSAVTNWRARDGNMRARYAYTLQAKDGWSAVWILTGELPAKLAPEDKERTTVLAELGAFSVDRLKLMLALLKTQG